MLLQELREKAMPLARRLAFMRDEMQRLHNEMHGHLSARNAPQGYHGALLYYASYELDHVTPFSAAEWIAKELNLLDVFNSPAAQDMPPERQMELMLQGRFLAVVKGN